jgi:hypothetical protein
LTAQKAASIIQRALHPNKGLFNFNSETFKSTSEAYKAIEKEVGPTNVFRPISKYGNQRRRGLIIVAKFREEQDAMQVTKEGISLEGVQYRGSPSNGGAENNMIRVSPTAGRSGGSRHWTSKLSSTLRKSSSSEETDQLWLL